MINYRIRSIRMLFVILMTLAAGAQMAHAAKGGRSDFYQKYMSRPSEELIRIGKDYRLRKNKPDSALLFFTIVAGRYTPNMSAEEKREVVEALNMNYFIYSFTYLNYPKAYENLLRAHTISKELGETSAALYFNLGSMYQLVAGQGRQWKLYSKALDCYRKGVRLALAKKDMTTADMAFTNMTTLADVVGEFANTKKEWDLYRKAHTKRNTEHYKYNITLYEGTRLKIAGQLQKAAEAYGRLIDIVPDTERNCRRRALAFVEARRCNDSCTTSTKDWPSWRRRRNSMSNTRLATACRASIRPTPSSMRTWGARPTTIAACTDTTRSTTH